MGVTRIRYERGGGRPPADDELLEVDEDGSWRVRRTVDGSCVGTFAGRLDDAEATALTRDAARAQAAGPAWSETPRDGATEQVMLGAGEEPSAQLAAGASGGVGWDPLLRRLRVLVETAAEQPDAAVAAVELVADAGGARLAAAGAGSLDVDAASVEVRLVHIDASGVPVATWAHSAGGPPTDAAPASDALTGAATAAVRWVPTGPGWTLPLPFEAPGIPGPGEWLQVWVRVTLRDDARRRARLFLAIPGRA